MIFFTFPPPSRCIFDIQITETPLRSLTKYRCSRNPRHPDNPRLKTPQSKTCIHRGAMYPCNRPIELLSVPPVLNRTARNGQNPLEKGIQRCRKGTKKAPKRYRKRAHYCTTCSSAVHCDETVPFRTSATPSRQSTNTAPDKSSAAPRPTAPPTKSLAPSRSPASTPSSYRIRPNTPQSPAGPHPKSPST